MASVPDPKKLKEENSRITSSIDIRYWPRCARSEVRQPDQLPAMPAHTQLIPLSHYHVNSLPFDNHSFHRNWNRTSNEMNRMKSIAVQAVSYTVSHNGIQLAQKMAQRFQQGYAASHNIRRAREFLGGKNKFGGSCWSCYAYRKMRAVKMVFVWFLRGDKEQHWGQTPVTTCPF